MESDGRHRAAPSDKESFMLPEPILDYLPKPFHKVDYGIGLIGAGGIAEIGHIPAYKKANYHVLAVADVAEQRRRYAQETFGLDSQMVFDDHRRLLDLPSIDIVDITLPHLSPHKIPIVHDAIDAGKHVLVEKPLAMNYQDAKDVVDHAARAGVKLAVCHQYRWMPVFRATKNLIDQGCLGNLFLVSMDERWAYDLPGLSYSQQPQVLFLIESIHFIDEFRWWTGLEPRQVFASISRRPDQAIRGETVGNLILEMHDNLRVVYTGNIASHPQSQRLRYRLEGTGGVLNAHFDDLWGPGGLEYSPAGSGASWFRPVLTGQGFPDGFFGLMGDLMESIAEDREPAVSGKDNLKTLQIVFAAYRSAELGRTVAPSEITATERSE